MAKFFVGQLVKSVRLPKKCHTSNRNHGAGLGEEGIVMGTTACPNLGFHGRSGDDVSVHLFLRGVTGMAPAYCFEPTAKEEGSSERLGTCEPLDKLLSGVSREAV